MKIRLCLNWKNSLQESFVECTPAQMAAIKDVAGRFTQDGDHVTLEIDTADETCVVLPSLFPQVHHHLIG